MKKLLALFTVFTLVFTLAACGEDDVRLPNLVGLTRSEVEERLDELGLDFHIFHDEETIRDKPEMFLRYMNHNIGQEVPVGTRVQVVLSSKLEEPDRQEPREPVPEYAIEPDEEFEGYEDVSLYLDTHREFPSNYIDYDEAQSLGYERGDGTLADYTDSLIYGIPFDASEHDEIPHDDFDFYKAYVDYDGGVHSDNYLVYSSDFALVFHTDDGFDTITQRFGTAEYPPMGLVETKYYTDRDTVALYFRTFGKLPPNYIIRYDEDNPTHVEDNSADRAWDLYREFYGEPDPEFYDDHNFVRTLSNNREHYADYENEHGQSLGEHFYNGYWWFHGGRNMPGRTDFFIADTGVIVGDSRGSRRFVFSPEKRMIYFTADHFETYTLLYGNADDDPELYE